MTDIIDKFGRARQSTNSILIKKIDRDRLKYFFYRKRNSTLRIINSFWEELCALRRHFGLILFCCHCWLLSCFIADCQMRNVNVRAVNPKRRKPSSSSCLWVLLSVCLDVSRKKFAWICVRRIEKNAWIQFTLISIFSFTWHVYM